MISNSNKAKFQHGRLSRPQQQSGRTSGLDKILLMRESLWRFLWFWANNFSKGYKIVQGSSLREQKIDFPMVSCTSLKSRTLDPFCKSDNLTMDRSNRSENTTQDIFLWKGVLKSCLTTWSGADRWPYGFVHHHVDSMYFDQWWRGKIPTQVIQNVHVV